MRSETNSRKSIDWKSVGFDSAIASTYTDRLERCVWNKTCSLL